MTAAQYRRAMALLDALMRHNPTSKKSLEGRALDLLADLIEDYERERWPLEAVTNRPAKSPARKKPPARKRRIP